MIVYKPGLCTPHWGLWLIYIFCTPSCLISCRSLTSSLGISRICNIFWNSRRLLVVRTLYFACSRADYGVWCCFMPVHSYWSIEITDDLLRVMFWHLYHFIVILTDWIIVPHGSIAGPILFTIYGERVNSIFQRESHQFYSDDMQRYVGCFENWILWLILCLHLCVLSPLYELDILWKIRLPGDTNQ